MSFSLNLQIINFAQDVVTCNVPGQTITVDKGGMGSYNPFPAVNQTALGFSIGEFAASIEISGSKVADFSYDSTNNTVVMINRHNSDYVILVQTSNDSPSQVSLIISNTTPIEDFYNSLYSDATTNNSFSVNTMVLALGLDTTSSTLSGSKCYEFIDDVNYYQTNSVLCFLTRVFGNINIGNQICGENNSICFDKRACDKDILPYTLSLSANGCMCKFGADLHGGLSLWLLNDLQLCLGKPITECLSKGSPCQKGIPCCSPWSCSVDGTCDA